MTELASDYKALAAYRPAHKVRFVTAASLFDGHDAAINIMRRILQGMGAEVIHLGHNRSVDEIVTAALQEDVQGIAISSYQGGHVEYFKYMIDLLRQRGGAHVRVFGGGGGVIVPSEIAELHAYGVERIYSPEDGQRMGLAGMIGEMMMRCDVDLSTHAPRSIAPIRGRDDRSRRSLAQLITALENGAAPAELRAELARRRAHGEDAGGRHHRHGRRRQVEPHRRADPAPASRPGRRATIAVISIDPSRRKSGGALLGDRIRMNAIAPWNDGSRVTCARSPRVTSAPRSARPCPTCSPR